MIRKLETERYMMVERHLKSRGISDSGVLEAFKQVQRHEFVGDKNVLGSYADHPIPIGEGQTISQPYIVALMTEALGLTGKERVLEVGTGSGYQTAIASLLAEKIYTVERIESLFISARDRLGRLGYANIEFKLGDGTLGWGDEAPFDCVIVTAAAKDIPPALVAQIADGGRMVIPVGSNVQQELVVVRRRGDELEEERLCGCVFVKLIGEQSWKA